MLPAANIHTWNPEERGQWRHGFTVQRRLSNWKWMSRNSGQIEQSSRPRESDVQATYVCTPIHSVYRAPWGAWEQPSPQYAPSGTYTRARKHIKSTSCQWLLTGVEEWWLKGDIRRTLKPVYQFKNGFTVYKIQYIRYIRYWEHLNYLAICHFLWRGANWTQ